MDIDPIRDAEQLLSLRNVAVLAGVALKTVRRWIGQGIENNRGQIVKLRTIRVGGLRKTTRQAYRVFVKRASLRREDDS